jgi:hypothetical protein
MGTHSGGFNPTGGYGAAGKNHQQQHLKLPELH